VGHLLNATLNQPFAAALRPNDFNFGAWFAWDKLKRQAQQLARNRIS
jgi:hypothetical protein